VATDNQSLNSGLFVFIIPSCMTGGVVFIILQACGVLSQLYFKTQLVSTTCYNSNREA